MTLNMKDTAISSIEEVNEFLKSSSKLEFKREKKEEAYIWMEKTLLKFRYTKLGKKDKGIIKRYMEKAGFELRHNKLMQKRIITLRMFVILYGFLFGCVSYKEILMR